MKTITPAAAEVLVAGGREVSLGLFELHDPVVAATLTKAPQGVALPQLRAATPSVIKILDGTRSVTTPPLESLYVLPDTAADGGQGGSDDFPIERRPTRVVR